MSKDGNVTVKGTIKKEDTKKHKNTLIFSHEDETTSKEIIRVYAEFYNLNKEDKKRLLNEMSTWIAKETKEL